MQAIADVIAIHDRTPISQSSAVRNVQNPVLRAATRTVRISCLSMPGAAAVAELLAFRAHTADKRLRLLFCYAAALNAYKARRANIHPDL